VSLRPSLSRRVVWAGLLCAAGLTVTHPGQAQAQAKTQVDSDWQAVRPGTVVLFRHALAPGGGDPPGFKLDDCRSQRNLSDEGRTQARGMGAAFKSRGIMVGAVWSSQWCRTRETADLAFPGQRIDQPAFNSFFNQPDAAQAQTRAARELLACWRGPGVLVVTTHQVNITALTGVVPGSGEGVVLRITAAGPEVAGRIAP
jgi:phosphohistidine phosphatase SixA